MFFNSGNQMAQMVNKHQWDKINKKLHSASAQEKVDLANACGTSFDEDSLHTLILMLDDSDDNVLLATAKALGEVGGDNAKTHLQLLLDHVPAGNSALKNAILESVAKIRASNRR